jgi:hypothetical protein
MLCPSDSFSIFNILPTIHYTLAQKQVWSNYGSAHPISAGRLERDKLGNRTSRVLPIGFHSRSEILSRNDSGSQLTEIRDHELPRSFAFVLLVCGPAALACGW